MQEALNRHRRRWDSLQWVENPRVRKALGKWVVLRSHYLRQMIREENRRQLVARRKAKKRKAKERKSGKSNPNGRSKGTHHGKT